MRTLKDPRSHPVKAPQNPKYGSTIARLLLVLLTIGLISRTGDWNQGTTVHPPFFEASSASSRPTINLESGIPMMSILAILHSTATSDHLNHPPSIATSACRSLPPMQDRAVIRCLSCQCAHIPTRESSENKNTAQVRLDQTRVWCTESLVSIREQPSQGHCQYEAIYGVTAPKSTIRQHPSGPARYTSPIINIDPCYHTSDDHDIMQPGTLLSGFPLKLGFVSLSIYLNCCCSCLCV